MLTIRTYLTPANSFAVRSPKALIDEVLASLGGETKRISYHYQQLFLDQESTLMTIDVVGRLDPLDEKEGLHQREQRERSFLFEFGSAMSRRLHELGLPHPVHVNYFPFVAEERRIGSSHPLIPENPKEAKAA